jgi:hypothetical protein
VSRSELRLAHLLDLVLDVVHDPAPVLVSTGRTRRVDMVIPALGLIIEYDGEYYHRRRPAQDREKSLQLLEAGYRVLRVRERPLRLIGPQDVSVDVRADPLAVAETVLTEIRKSWPQVTAQLPHDEPAVTQAIAAADAAWAELKRLRAAHRAANGTPKDVSSGGELRATGLRERAAPAPSPGTA